MASSGNVKLHRIVLNRCLPEMVKDLDFKAVSIYIQQKELFDDVILRDISEQRITSDKIRQLIHRIQQRDHDTYDKFKKCLVLSKQAHLKDLLEEEEAKVATEAQGTARTTKSLDNITMAVGTRIPATAESAVLYNKTSNDNGKPLDIYTRVALWMKLSQTFLSQTQATGGSPASRREYMQHPRQQMPSDPFLQPKNPEDFQDFHRNKKRDVQVEEPIDRGGFMSQAASDWGIYKRAHIWYDLVSDRKPKECNPQLKRTKQVMLQEPIIKERVTTEMSDTPRELLTHIQSSGPGIKQVEFGSPSARGGNSASQGTTLCISGLSGGRSATFYLEENRMNRDGAACGPPKCSSTIHQSKSSNAVLEGNGDKCNSISSLISPMSSVSLQGTEYILKEHFDVCIIYCEADENDVYEFKDHLEKLDLGLGEHPKICLYTEEKVWGPTKLTEKVKFVCKHCTLIFVYLSKRCSSDEYADFFRNEVIMATIKNCRVRPVLSEKDCAIPYGLHNAPKIEWYKRDARSYKENIVSLFDINKSGRLRREAEGIESILSTL